MRFIADLHIHSRYSRATSRDMCPEALWRWAQVKGISVIGTGDFTHPLWIKELTEKLVRAGNGLYVLRKGLRTGDVPESCRDEIYFLPTAEISCIYSRGGRTRKVHALVLAPDFKSAERINRALAAIGNIKSDGRPILGLDARELLKIVLSGGDGAMLIPAHAWTPHFSVFGARSGFDSLEECFGELTPHIHAIETGLSSDPAMNWRLSALDRIALISNSDAHSPSKIGREATVFGTDISCQDIFTALRTRRGLAGTIEFFPEEGKYHNDGHRACDVSLTPKEALRLGNLCPACGKALTIGVLHRVEEMADRREGFRPKGAAPYRSIIPLQEIVAETMGVGPASKKVATEYYRLITAMGSEFNILLETPLKVIGEAGSDRLREAIGRMRDGNVDIIPGYDGEYGRVRIF